MSSIGVSVPRCSSCTSASRPGAAARPTRVDSRSGSRVATAEQAPTATRAEVIRRCGSTTITADTMAIEITRYAREPSLRKVERARPSGSGTKRPVTSSSRASWVARFPVTNSGIGTPRTPRHEAISTIASRASRLGRPSAAGDALQTLPTTVARFWIWSPPIAWAATLSPWKRGGSGCSATSVHVAPAGMSQPPSRRSMARSPTIPEMSRTSSSTTRPTRAGK
jgi:hypothetical protein